MIVDSLKSLKRYAVPQAEKILKFLNDHDCKSLGAEEKEIDGRNLFVRIMSYVPKAAEENRFEIHRIYADVQVVITGKELMQTARREDLSPITEYDPQGDYQFFKPLSKNLSSLIVKENEFVIFYPQEAHRPSCLLEGHSGLVKKMVFKVRIN